jgi:hypothetical protein
MLGDEEEVSKDPEAGLRITIAENNASNITALKCMKFLPQAYTFQRLIKKGVYEFLNGFI